jgi:sensor histidine kinase YesM
MENPYKNLPYTALALLVVAMTLVSGTLVSLARGHFSVPSYMYALTYTFACAFWIGIIVGLAYNYIAGLRRGYFYLLFALLIIVGTGLGTQTASLIIHKRLYAGPKITAFSFVVSLGLSLLAVANEHLRDSFSRKVSDLKEEEIESRILKRCDIEARMKSVRTRLDPYFVLNALDSLAGAVRSDPKLAERNIAKLSNLYRQAVSVTDESLVSVEEEIGLIKDYLELEGQRLGEKLRYAIDCPDELLDARIPGLLLEPVVENSIKHGGSGGRVNVTIKLWRKDRHLMLSVTDDGRGFDQSRVPFGLGLFGIQQRLKRMYDDAFRFDIESEVGRGTTVTFALPMG